MQDRTFDGASLENALKTGALEGKKSAITVSGMIKTSEHAGHIGFTAAGCESWIDLPVTMIDTAKHIGESRCKDHSHPLMEITLKNRTTHKPKYWPLFLLNLARYRLRITLCVPKERPVFQPWECLVSRSTCPIRLRLAV